MAEEDRRVRRTRRMLHEAFISLVLEKGYEKTTVQDILDRADIGRSTFYVHYRDKEALLITSFDEMREQLHREINDATPPGGPIDVARPAALIFEHAYHRQRIYRALCGRQGGNVVHRYLHGLVGDLLLEQLRPWLAQTGSDLPADVAAEFYTAAALGLLTWWIDHDFCRGHAWLTGIYRQLALTGLGSGGRVSPQTPAPAPVPAAAVGSGEEPAAV
jgi:AcrR family transcriptional regulator